MSNTKTILLRLNLNKSLDKEVWEYLRTADKKDFKSYSRSVALAVYDYFQRLYKSKDDPYLETREREEKFIRQIIEAVEKALEKTLPSFLTACLAGIVQPYVISAPAPVTAQNAEPKEDEVDWEFLSDSGN